MSERLKDFEKKCWNNQTNHLDAEKFAELILEDVMSICEDLGLKGMDGHYCVDVIRNKFELWPMLLNNEENT